MKHLTEMVRLTEKVESLESDLDSYSYAHDELENAIRGAIDEYDRALILFQTEGAISTRRVKAIMKQLREVI